MVPLVLFVGPTSKQIKQAALRAASLRWHPDKFMSKYGPRIASEDRANIAKVHRDAGVLRFLLLLAGWENSAVHRIFGFKATPRQKDKFTRQ